MTSIKIITTFLVLFLNTHAVATIFDEREAEQAELELLQDETVVFQSIGIGIALSVAQCDAIELCPNVKAGEIKALIKMLDKRIDNLTLRQRKTEDDPKALGKVLATYQSERNNYHAHLEKLQSFLSNNQDEDDTLELEADFTSSEKTTDDEASFDILTELAAFEDGELEDEGDFEDDFEDLPVSEEPNP